MNDNPKILRINGINGIYNELYNPVPHKQNIEIVDGELNVGAYFWNNILSEKALKELLEIISINSNDEMPPQFLVAINNKKKFVENVTKARTSICDQGISSQQFYSYLQTLAIVCEMYNEFIYTNVNLSINEGFLCDETSSKKLFVNSTNPKDNPSFVWMLQEIIPVIIEYKPNIVFFDGRPNISIFALAKILKKFDNAIHLCSSNNSSEYYGLSKIKEYLVSNQYFFKVFDSVILDNFEIVESELVNSLKENLDFSHVNNIIYKTKKEIVCSENKNTEINYKLKIQSRALSNENAFKLSPKSIENVHLIPYHKCYWNKCTFCGINKKYIFDDVDDDVKFKENLYLLKNQIINDNIKYVWFIDEAIPPYRLEQIALYFIDNNINVFWQARCRIEKELLSSDLCELLYKSGLRELRLGLESASLKILKLMQKFPDDFSLNMVTEIAALYHKNRISLHFPMIVGFPGETTEDRRITYSYLAFLHQKYPSVTFNINILAMDVSSALFKNWYLYDIHRVELPCKKNELIGNIAVYDNEMYETLDKERNAFMREQLYPWYPTDSYIEPYIFYRLSETIRNTLIWKTHPELMLSNNADIILDKKYILSDNISYSQLSNMEDVCIYNWDTHRYFKTTFDFFKQLQTWNTPTTLKDMILTAQIKTLKTLDYQSCYKIFDKLINYGFLKLIT